MERRNTLQRRLVLDAVRTLLHPDAEEVYRAVSAKKPNISRATVYRNLHLLAEEGAIGEIQTGEGADRYDHEARRHCHFRCRACGKMYDAAFFPQPFPHPRYEDGFFVESCNVEFAGLCPACDKKYQNKETDHGQATQRHKDGG